MIITDTWQKSTYSATNVTCVEVAFTRSSFCGADGCVEVAMPCVGESHCVEVGHAEGNVLVRDSKNPDQQPLSFTAEEWSAFVRGVRAGEFGG